jgi:transcriptional regulator with XRE-family HTH domain
LVYPAEVFPERRPGTLLRGSRNREGLTQQQLAERCSISRHHISEMENGRRTIGKKNAGKLAALLNVDPRLFL